MPDFESCEARFLEFASSSAAQVHTPGRNEAQTRLDMINKLIVDCLGWRGDEVFVETSYDGTYSDYEIGTPARQLVVEAKREGSSFEIPAGYGRSTAPISQLERDNAELGTAIRQAMGYGQTRAIPIAAVSNGHQMVAFIASRVDGTPPLSGRALIFESLEAIRERFTEFWNALSPPGVDGHRLHRMLDADASLPPPAKPSASFYNYPGYKNRNPVAAELQILGGMFLEDILHQPEIEADFLRECYTPSGTLSQYALVSREILAARYSLFLENEAEATLQPVRSRDGVSEDLLSDVFAASITKRPVILLGDVGVGKTMFTRHFIKVEATDVLTNSFVFYIDFGSKPALAEDLNAYVRDELQRQLLEEYGQDINERGFVRSVYRSDLQRFANGIYSELRTSSPDRYSEKELERLEELTGDRSEHLKRSLDHYSRAQKRPAVVFLDNVDQRPFSFQEEVFLISQSIASDWHVACFIALRPETFYRSKRQGSLTGYQPRVFTIEPPRVDRVVTRRLAFARKELEVTGRLPSFPTNVTIDLTRLEQYIGLLLDAFEDNEDLIRFVDNLSGGNVRAALGFIVSFVGSGHVDTEKIFAALDRTGYVLPLHEFERAVIYGEHEWFYPADSPIANVFAISRPDAREHFLQPLVIAYVGRAGHSGTDQGFVPTPRVYEFAQSLGFDSQQTAASLNRCVEKNLIDTLPRYIQEEVTGADSERCRITTAGAYTIAELISDFQYLDAVSIDTPIVPSQWRGRIHGGQSFETRLERAETFRHYLDEQWAPFRGTELAFSWDQLSTAAAEKLDIVRQSQNRSRRRDRS